MTILGARVGIVFLYRPGTDNLNFRLCASAVGNFFLSYSVMRVMVPLLPHLHHHNQNSGEMLVGQNVTMCKVIPLDLLLLHSD